MLTDLMFYGIPTDNPADQVDVGAFRLSFSQIVIGTTSLDLIVHNWLKAQLLQI